MENFEREGKSIGLIFDISNRHSDSGRRIIDVVKKRMISIVKKLFEDGEDSFYLYHPEIIESVILHGDQVCSIGNYSSDGWKFNLGIALRQTLYVLMAEDLTHRKYLFLITDRFNDAHQIKKAIQINFKEMIDCNFIIIGIGKNYNHKDLKELSELPEITYLHIDQPEELEPCLLKEKKDGQNQSCCETNERCERVQLTSGHNCSVPRAVRSADTVDAESFQTHEKQLLPVVFSGRLFPESGLHSEPVDKFSEECRQIEATECVEDSAT
jgi:hypothetical protein